MLPVYDDESCHEHYLSLGLGFFCTLMKASHENQMRMLRENIGLSDLSLSSALKEDGPQYSNYKYDASVDQALRGFQSDSDRDAPNAAWIWSTRNKVDACYCQANEAGLRKWGYVMWDKERLERWNILQESPNDCLIAQETVPF